MKDKQKLGVLFEVASREVVEAVPAEVTAEAIVAAAAVVLVVAVADTEDTVELAGSELLELVVGVNDTVDQKADTDSGEAEPQMVDWVMGWEACNKEVVVWLGSHSVLELERGVPQVVAGAQLDGVGQELTADYVCLMHYQFS